jgi:hypothetical protein
MLMGGAMVFGSADSKSGFILIILASAIFSYIGWWSVSLPLVSIALLLLVLSKMTERKVEG